MVKTNFVEECCLKIGLLQDTLRSGRQNPDGSGWESGRKSGRESRRESGWESGQVWTRPDGNFYLPSPKYESMKPNLSQQAMKLGPNDN